MENLKPNEKRAKNAILFIWIVLALEIVNIISSYLQYELLQVAANGWDISDKADVNDMREGIVALFYFIASVISAITFIMWFRRAYYNLHQRVNSLAHSEGWAAGCWFVPIVNLYRPYQIMKELYVETKNFFSRKGLSEKINYTTDYVGWWWALWIITNIIGNFVFRFSLRYAETIEDYITMTFGQIIVGVLGIPLALITIKVIKDYAKVEPLLSEITEDMEDVQ